MTKRKDEPTIEERWAGDEMKFEKVENLEEFFAKRKADPLFGIKKPEGYVDDDDQEDDRAAR
jgi:hypothetical protein